MMNLPAPELTAPLTDEIQAVLNLAHDHAKRLGNSHVAVEHLLLALVQVEGEGKSAFQWIKRPWASHVAQLMRDYGLQPRRIEEIIRRQNTGFNRRYDGLQALPLAQDAQETLRLATDELYWADQQALNTSHLLLAIVLQPKGYAVSKTLRMDVKKVRERLRHGLAVPHAGLLRSRSRSRYTPAAQVVLSLAQTEAKALHHTCIGTEHLLLGLARERAGVAGRILKNLGVQLDALRLRIEQMSPGEADFEIVGLSDSYKRLLDRAGDEMRNRDHRLIGTGHLLFHLLRYTDEVAMRALRRLNIKPPEVYAQMAQYMALHPTVLEGVEVHYANPLVEFTPQARAILKTAQEEAERLEHHILDTSHLLMGLLLTENSPTATLLESYGCNRRRVRGLIELMTAHDYLYSLKPMRLSADMEAVLNLATQRAGHDGEYPQIEALHLLLALVSQPDSLAAQILQQLHLERERIYDDVLARL